MSDKIYLVRAIECDGSSDVDDHIVGYVTTYKEAEAACKKFEAENTTSSKFWNEYGCNCNIDCANWPVSNISAANVILERKRKRNKCPYADLDLREMYHDNGDKMNRVEIVCKNRTDKCYCPINNEYEYLIEEVEKL